jgi:serine phosphatase RsbU (regulator of sigma subunit)
MLPTACFHAVPIRLEPGSRVVLLSDGVSESENLMGEQFTVDYFKHYLTAEDPIRSVFEAVDRFSGGEPQADDRTMLTIDRLELAQIL